MKIVYLLLIVFVATCNAFPSGAPAIACTSMTPNHGATAQTGNSPVTLTISGTSYTSASNLTITIRATSGTFRGFFLQARSAVDSTNTIAYGEFFDLPSNAKAITCNDLAASAATHTDRTDKTEIVLKWRAPNPAGNIRFTLTYVQTYTVFWTGITSNVITGPGSAALPTTIPNGVLIETISTNGCGTSKGCYRSPPGCTGATCQYIMTYTNNGSNVNFELLYRPAAGTGSNWWAALGISDDTRMGNDTVFACTRFGDQVYFKNYYNNRRTPEPISNIRAGVSNIFVSWMEGAVQCRFTRAKAPSAIGVITVPGAIKNLNNPYHFIFGFGGTIGGGNLNYHRSTTPRVSPQLVNVANVRMVSSASTKTLTKAHAAVMSIAWVWLAPMAMFCARYMRAFKTEWMGTAAWFQIHRTSMVSAVLLTIIGFILIWVHVQSWSIGAGVHAYTGTATVVLALLQPIMAYFRCHPGEDKRWIFNYAHRTVGLLAIALALVTVFLGMDLFLLDLPSYTTWILVAFLCVLVVIAIIREYMKLTSNMAAVTVNADIPMENKEEGGDAPDTAPPPPPKGESSFGKCSFFLLSLFAIATAFTIIAAIAVYPF